MATPPGLRSRLPLRIDGADAATRDEGGREVDLRAIRVAATQRTMRRITGAALQVVWETVGWHQVRAIGVPAGLLDKPALFIRLKAN